MVRVIIKSMEKNKIINHLSQMNNEFIPDSSKLDYTRIVAMVHSTFMLLSDAILVTGSGLFVRSVILILVGGTCGGSSCSENGRINAS